MTQDHDLEHLIKKDKAAALGALLDTGLSPNSTNAEGESLLALAAGAGSLKIVDLLLERGADPNFSGTDDVSPLECAVAAGHDTILERLIEAGSEIGEWDEYHEDLSPPLVTAMYLGHWRIAELLIEAGSVGTLAEGWLSEALEDAVKGKGRGKRQAIAKFMQRVVARFPEGHPLPIEDQTLSGVVQALRSSAETRALAKSLAWQIDTFKAACDTLYDLFAEDIVDIPAVWRIINNAPGRLRRKLASVALCEALCKTKSSCINYGYSALM